MRRPSFQFYPGDWLGNPNLRRCTHAERGIWIAVICLMHDSDAYGVLRWPLREIASAVNCKASDLTSLAAKGVLKGDDKHVAEPYVYVPRSGRRDGQPVTLIEAQAGPLWFCSRMVRDEYVRQVRGEGTRFGESNETAPKAAPKATPKQAPKPPIGDGPSSSSSSSSSKEKNAPLSAGASDAAALLPEVEAQTLMDWLQVRKAKRAGPITTTVAKGLRAEAAKAGLPLQTVVENCCIRNWQSFKAEWVTEGHGGQARPVLDSSEVFA